MRVEPGPVFIPALTTNHFFSSLPPLLPLAPAASPPFYRPPLQLQQQVRTLLVSDPRKRSTTSTSTAPSLLLQPLSASLGRKFTHYLRSPSVGARGHSGTVARLRSLALPPLPDRHSRTHTLSLYLSLSFSRPSWSSPRSSSPPHHLQHFHHRRLYSPTLCPIVHPCHTDNFRPLH